MVRLRESKVRTHKEADDMPAGSLKVENPVTEETWPLNENEKSRLERLSVVLNIPFSLEFRLM